MDICPNQLFLHGIQDWPCCPCSVFPLQNWMTAVAKTMCAITLLRRDLSPGNGDGPLEMIDPPACGIPHRSCRSSLCFSNFNGTSLAAIPQGLPLLWRRETGSGRPAKLRTWIWAGGNKFSYRVVSHSKLSWPITPISLGFVTHIAN